MATLRKGDRGSAVRTLQNHLRKVLNRTISVDGDFGPATERAVRLFQSLYDLHVDGIAGSQTQAKLKQVYEALFMNNSGLLHFTERRFVVFVDAGHGGINDQGTYVTPGKRARHAGVELHEDGHYYEGYENRIVAEAFIEACTEAGIQCVRTYHPWRDTPLSDRSDLVRGWLRRGYYGYLHSFHSNAISSRNTPDKLEATRGFMVFNTLGDNFSDEIATQHFTHVREETNNAWTYRTQTSRDGDVDYEVNFQILRETDLSEFPFFGSILDEWGFHTSRTDTLYITNAQNRKRRVAACIRTAKWVKKELRSRLGL